MTEEHNWVNLCRVSSQYTNYFMNVLPTKQLALHMSATWSYLRTNFIWDLSGGLQGPISVMVSVTLESTAWASRSNFIFIFPKYAVQSTTLIVSRVDEGCGILTSQSRGKSTSKVPTISRILLQRCAYSLTWKRCYVYLSPSNLMVGVARISWIGKTRRTTLILMRAHVGGDLSRRNVVRRFKPFTFIHSMYATEKKKLWDSSQNWRIWVQFDSTWIWQTLIFSRGGNSWSERQEPLFVTLWQELIGEETV